MSDAAEGDVPVNPYTLLEAVNAASRDARWSWLIFLVLLVYFSLTLAGITHRDLLLSGHVGLPLFGVGVPLPRLFLLVPLAVCVLHFGLLLQHAVLARKVLEFDRALRGLEASDAPTHPLRLEVHSYFITQSLAGPELSRLLRFFMLVLGWLTLAAAPILLLLFAQIAFLPSHDVDMTWTHRLLVMLDTVIVISIGFFLLRADTSFRRALQRSLTHRPLLSFVTTIALAAALLFSLLAATVPGEAMDRMAFGVPTSVRTTVAGLSPAAHGSPADTMFGFRRNLVVTDVDVADSGRRGRAVSLRDRDLRFARLDRSNLQRADLTGADLTGASLSGADLRNAHLGCHDLSAARAGDRPAARCTNLQGANLSGANASMAHFSGADLTGADLTESHLDGAEFDEASMQGAVLRLSHAERAHFISAALQGANLLQINAQGADFTGAGLQGADLTAAGLQGAALHAARLQGALVGDADLDGADMSGAELAGARLGGARLTGTDLRGAKIWQTQSPARDAAELADTADLRLQPPDDTEITGLTTLLGHTDDPVRKARLAELLATLADASSGTRWRGSPDAAAWQSLVSGASRADGEAYRSQLTQFLGNISCRGRWPGNAVATGIAMRAAAARFKGNAEALLTRLTAADCVGARGMSPTLLGGISAGIDEHRGTPNGSSAQSSRIGGDSVSGTLTGPFPVPAAGRR